MMFIKEQQSTIVLLITKLKYNNNNDKLNASFNLKNWTDVNAMTTITIKHISQKRYLISHLS